MSITPSAKSHSLVNPLPYANAGREPNNKFVYWIKMLFGTPIPYVATLYSVALLTSMSAMELAGWLTALLTLIYIAFDRFDSKREFRFFLLGADLSLLTFLVVLGLGLWLNAPAADFAKELGSVRWIILLYCLAYCFSLFPGINKYFYIVIGLSILIGGYAIFQHFTGIDLRYEWGLREQSAVTPAPFSGATVYQSVGLMSHHLTYGYLFSMVFCFPLAALMLGRNRSLAFRLMMAAAAVLIGLSLVWTYGRGVWIATAAAVLFMSAYVSKKALFSIIIIGTIMFGTLYSSNYGFRARVDSIWATDNKSNNDRQDLWRANVAMLKDHPWIGIGWNQNEVRVQEYFGKLGIQNNFSGHAHNNYLQILATTGIIGSTAFMFFVIGFLLMTHRLWTDIPKSHYWHRVFVLGALGSQVALHTGGLTQWNFGDAEVNHFFIFLLAIVAYMTERYNSGVVPDDYSL